MILPINQTPKDDPKVLKDQLILMKFVAVYCHDKHAGALGSRRLDMKILDTKELNDNAPCLCPDCQKLLAHALVKRAVCPMQPKPACKHCPKHCYHPRYRQEIREVMKYSGRKLVLRGRLDYLLHLLF